MQRRKFVASSLMAASAFTAGVIPGTTAQNSGDTQNLLELREYEMHFGASENDLHTYFQHALIPALNRAGVKNVGVFRETGKSEPAKIYLLIVYANWEEFTAVAAGLRADDGFNTAAADYKKLSPEKVPFTRYISKLMIAFKGLPQLNPPSNGPRIFELRTYEGYNEDAVQRKMKMFNDEEIKIFYRTKLNPVFFGEVVSGKDLPCLTYMLVFGNMDERDRNWAAFSADPDWKRISALPEYANTVSRITKIFLEPLPYSQV